MTNIIIIVKNIEKNHSKPRMPSQNFHFKLNESAKAQGRKPLPDLPPAQLSRKHSSSTVSE